MLESKSFSPLLSQKTYGLRICVFLVSVSSMRCLIGFIFRFVRHAIYKLKEGFENIILEFMADRLTLFLALESGHLHVDKNFNYSI